MKRILFVILAVAALFAFACKQESYAKTNTAATDSNEPTGVTSTNTEATNPNATPMLSAKDQEFVKKAAEGGMMEVTLGQLAVAKATSNDVKDFGNRMVSDHGKANDDLKQLASNKGVTLPTQPAAEEEKTSNDLSKKSGTAFDKAYMSDMVKDHNKDVQEFKKAANEVQDPDLKSWVSKTLPVIEDHLKQAKQIAGKVK